jgi:NhaA family Na+:H+ antiporter
MTDDSKPHAVSGDHAGGRSAGSRRRRIRAAVPRLSKFAVEHLLLLPLGALVAMVWVNTAAESYYRVSYSLAFVVNDIAMAFFFALIAKEVVEATAPGGVLHSWRRAGVPLIAAIGAAVVPALLHVQMTGWFEEPMLALGWPVSIAMDLAMSYFVARIIFRRHSIIAFLLLLGIASDTLGLAAIALFHPTDELRPIRGVLVFAASLALAAGLRRGAVKSFWPYLLGPGLLSWIAFVWSNIHPALSLVPIMPFLPHAARDPGFFVDAPPTAKDTLNRFELWWRYPAQIALFFFGLVNAGVPLQALEPGTWALPIAVIVGKPVGVIAGAALAIAVGLHLPNHVGWRELIVGGLIAGVGFSVGLFFCAALLPPGQVLLEMRMGALLTLTAAPIAIIAAVLLGVGRFARR